jgi:two-component system response regulator YesN
MIPIKILLVDDEVIIKRVIIEKIDWVKYDMEIVKAANSAREALDYLEKFDVDLVITDMKMPLMDGNDFIEEAKHIRRNLKFLALSAYTDFDIVRKSFKLGVYDYMQKSDINTSTMYNLLTKIRNEINQEKRKNAGQNLNSGTDATKLNENESDMLSEISGSREYSVVYVRVSSGKGILRDISGIIADNKGKKEKIALLETDEESVTILIEHDFTSYDKKKNIIAYVIKQIRTGFESKNNYDYCIGVSKMGFGSKIESLKYEAQKATEAKYYSDGTNNTFYFTDKNYSLPKDDDRLTIDHWKAKIETYTKRLDIAGANRVFTKLYDFVLEADLAKNKCQELFFNIYIYYVNFLYSNNIIDSGIQQDYAKVYSIIKQLDRFTQLNEWINNNLSIIEKKYAAKYKSDITQILKIYVKQNLDKDLSLSCIAEQYGFNHSYLSHLFKEKEGVPLRRYINNVRIDKAKYYLVNTNIKVKDICSLVGYSNPEHFSREFKKKQGQSPNYFRSQRTV